MFYVAYWVASDELEGEVSGICSHEQAARKWLAKYRDLYHPSKSGVKKFKIEKEAKNFISNWRPE